MPDRIGPDLLGRLVVPDERDWDLARLERHLSAFSATTADTTVRTLHDSGQLDSWAEILLFWRWIKSFFAVIPGPPTPPSPPPAPAAILWSDPVVLDQGNYGTCVGNGWAGWGDSAPIQDRFNETDARAIYYEATVFDGSPDNPDAPGGGQQGSTVRSGAKAMRARGKCAAFAFLTVVEARDKIQQQPLVFGTDWTENMFSPDAAGFVTSGGQVAGGHCYLAIGYDPLVDVWSFQNSWGLSWGVGGRFKMRGSTVSALQAGNGEICYALEV